MWKTPGELFYNVWFELRYFLACPDWKKKAGGGNFCCNFSKFYNYPKVHLNLERQSLLYVVIEKRRV